MIKKGQSLPDDDHVLRHVPWQRLLRDGNDKVLGFLPQAFQLRDGEESLSANWLENCDGTHSNKIQQTVSELRAAIKVGPKSAFGVAQVGKVKEVCKSNNRAHIRIVLAPTKSIASHVEIKELPRDDIQLLTMLATEAFIELVHNKSIL